MKKILFTLIFLYISANFAFTQCREFTHAEVVPKLGDFLLTGKYHAMSLSEGEEILIFKTVNKGLTYRFVIMSEKTIPQPHFLITDWENNLIYDNSKDNYSNIFDYKCIKTQRIKIVIKVPKSSNTPGIHEGCVSLVMGIKS
jgi:hypothetical protein